MDVVTEKAYAKINLTLAVGNKRADGYHDITSIMQTVSLCDKIRLEKDDEISLTCGKKSLPSGPTNLAWRAAEHFFSQLGIRGGVKIRLKKYIPVAAGLGGGSADAAAVLRGLNRLYNTGLTVTQLQNMGAKLGADVPFCIVGGTALAEGVGEILTPLVNNVNMNLVVTVGGEGASTKIMYEMLDKNEHRLDIDSLAMAKALENGDTGRAISLLGNDFEPVCSTVRPFVPELKQELIELGAEAAMMSGSGTSVFGWFSSHAKASKAAEALRNANRFAAVCTKLAVRNKL